MDIAIHLLFEYWNFFLDKTQIALNYFNLKSIKILDVGAKKTSIFKLILRRYIYVCVDT